MSFRDPSEPSTRLRIATTIRDQIKADDKLCLAACGARDYLALDCTGKRQGGLQFRVTITSPQAYHKIIVELTHGDEYRVQRIKLQRGTHEVIVEGKATVTVDHLTGTIRRMCNK